MTGDTITVIVLTHQLTTNHTRDHLTTTWNLRVIAACFPKKHNQFIHIITCLYYFQDPIIDDQNTRIHSFNDVRFIENPSSFGLKDLYVLAA